MVAAVDRRPTAELFMANLETLTQPKVEEPPTQAVKLSNAFEGPALGVKVEGPAANINAAPAANINAAPNALTAAAALAGGASVMPEDQKQGLASGAVLAGQSLQSMDGFQVGPQASEALLLGAQVAKLGMEAGKEAMKLGGEAIQSVMNVFSLGDRNSDGIPDSQQNLDVEEPKMRPAYTANMNSIPSPGLG